MHLVKEWGADKYDWALAGAAMNGQIPAMHLLKAWGTTHYSWSLAMAAKAGHIPAMQLLKEWGATAYEDALLYGSYHIDVVDLVNSWINKND